MYINVTGLNFFFSSLVSHRVFENSFADFLDWKCSKFLNWVLNFDFNSSIQKALNLFKMEKICTFCKQTVLDTVESKDFCRNSDMIYAWRSNALENNERDRYNDDHLSYLACLFKKAAREIKAIVAIDNKLSQKKSLKNPLAKYDPSNDWASSCPIIQMFVNDILIESKSDLNKVIFRNLIFIGNQKRNYPYKPQSCYFISCVIKYLHDKQKILDLLSTIGIAVGDDAVNRLEKRQIDEFNSIFWDIPKSSTVMAVMDNNQADFGSKNYNPLHDEHHVDCLNVLQVIKPAGNPDLDKTTKEMSELSTSFIESTCLEKKAGVIFVKSFLSYLIRLEENLPTEKLITPKIYDIIPINGSEDSTGFVPVSIIKLTKQVGNILRCKLLNEPKYVPFQMTDSEDK